jgi:hypothetical protein
MPAWRQRLLLSTPPSIAVAAAVLVMGACSGGPAAPTADERALRDHIDIAAYSIGLVVPNSAEIERVTGRAVAAIRAVEYERGTHASMEALDSSGRVIANLAVTYAQGVANPLVPGGRLAVDIDAGAFTEPLRALAVEHATRLHSAGYEAPALPENLEPGLYLVEGLAQDLQRWLNAIEAGDTAPASSGETVTLFGCNAGRSFETARWLFTAAPCLDAARASWLVASSDTDAAAQALRDALATLGETTTAFTSAMQE